MVKCHQDTHLSSALQFMNLYHAVTSRETFGKDWTKRNFGGSLFRFLSFSVTFHILNTTYVHKTTGQNMINDASENSVVLNEFRLHEIRDFFFVDKHFEHFLEF